MDKQCRDHAVVCGGSLAGLFTARVLAESYARVTVIERDGLDEGFTVRRGVPQARHVHGLLTRGGQALEELFPGLTRDLVDAGVPAMDMLADTRMYVGGHRFAQARSALPVLGVSRPFLEGHVRARVTALRNVSVLDRCDVLGLGATSDDARVVGVRILRRADGSAEETMPADLVVDATGRGSRAPVWLDALGHPAPVRDEVRIRLGYATQTYRLRPGALGSDAAVLLGATPRSPRGALLQPIEGDRWIVTLAGMLGEYPPTDPAGFLAFAASLRFPDIADALRDAEPLGGPVPFRFPANVRHRYDRLARWPEGFLVVGDAVCSTSPVYGHGMTVAALEALTLRRHLDEARDLQYRRCLREIARVAGVAWNLTLGGDLAFPGVPGRRNATVRVMNRYMSRLQRAASRDATVATAFARVAGLVDPPEALLRPAVARRVVSVPLRTARETRVGQPA